MKYTCTKTPSMFRKCDNIFLLCNVTHLRLGLGKLFMLGNHEPWTFLTTNQKELKMKIEPAFSLILNLCSFLFLIWYDGRKMDQLFEKKLIWEPLLSFSVFQCFQGNFFILQKICVSEVTKEKINFWLSQLLGGGGFPDHGWENSQLFFFKWTLP